MHQRYRTISPSETIGRRLRTILLPLLLFAAISVAAHAQNIFVISPAGGENLVVDSTTSIRWIAQGITGLLKVEYSSDSGKVWNLIDTVTAAAGIDTLFWKVPNDTTHKAFVRVSKVDSSKSGRSQRTFNIVSKPVAVLSVIYPNGGEVFKYDSSSRIIWQASNATGNLDVQLSIDSGKVWTTIATPVARAGRDTLAWTVPHDSTTTAFIRVRTADSSAGDVSNRAFTIKGSVNPKITLLNPNGGEVYAADSNVRIHWTSQDITGQLALEYSNDSGATWKPINTRQARPGLDSVNWKIPNDSTTRALVRIGPAQGIKDISDAVFTINGKADTATPTPVLTLIYPNGGERFRADSVIHIKWIAMNITGRIGIQLSTDNGTTWVQIDTAAARTGLDSVAWTVPNDSTVTALIRLSAMSGTIRDTSNGTFVIAPRATTIGVHEDRTGDTGALRLLGAFPNPAAGATEIRWIQASPAAAELRLYDNSGRLVESIDAGYRQIGSQWLNITATALPAGTYHYELHTGTAAAAGSLSIVR